MSSVYLWSPEDDKDKFAGVVLLKKGASVSGCALPCLPRARLTDPRLPAVCCPPSSPRAAGRLVGLDPRL